MKQKKEWTIFRGVTVEGWKKLLMMYFKFEASEDFLNCMEKQLTGWYLNFMAINNNQDDWLCWQPDKSFEYKKGEISSISSGIFIRQHFFDILITWQSLSKKIYEPWEKQIDFDDIVFKIEGLDLELCKYYKFPDKTLFFPIYSFIDLFEERYNLQVSKTFMQIANKQLTADFVRQTAIGTDAFKNIYIHPVEKERWIYYNISIANLYVKGRISKIPMYPYVHPGSDCQLCYICWQSKCGKIYNVSDLEIDEFDILFWFEGLQSDYYRKLLYPNEALPFKLKDLSYELVVIKLDVDSTLLLSFKQELPLQIDLAIEKIDNQIQKYVDEPIVKGKNGGGFVHNFKRKSINSNQWEYEIDTGSAGLLLYKKLLPFLSKLDCFLKVEIK